MELDEFITISDEIYNKEYDYSKVKWTGKLDDKVTIICPIHGEFKQRPQSHLKGLGCIKCRQEQDKTYKEAVEFCKKLYDGLYEYDRSTYINLSTPMRMICPKHGDFKMSLKRHKEGHRCSECANESRRTAQLIPFDEFKLEAIKIHNGKYEYDENTYVNYRTRMNMICPNHGVFPMTPTCHIQGQGCPKCAGTVRLTTEEFIQRANEIHKYKYIYNKVVYKNNHTEVCITCPIHGDFYQTSKNHLRGFGCKKCSNLYMDRDLFIERSNIIHDYKYIYDDVVYKNNHESVNIICPEHGSFSMRPGCHLNGQGCPKCKESHLERKVRIGLKTIESEFNSQERFEWMTNDKTNYKLPLDFYIPNLNLAIECQGEQHFIANFYKSKGIEYSEEHLKGVQYRDQRKRELCKENGVELVYFLDKKFEKHVKDLDNKYFTDVESLLSYINEKKAVIEDSIVAEIEELEKS